MGEGVVGQWLVGRYMFPWGLAVPVKGWERELVHYHSDQKSVKVQRPGEGET